MTLEIFGEENEAPPSSWHNYKWQLINSITTLQELQSHIPIESCDSLLPIRITPYYLKLVKENPVLQKTIIPIEHHDGIIDPLGEDSQMPVKGIVHRYPDRVLFLVTDFCFTNCQFCTRSRLINRSAISEDQINQSIQYIKDHKEIRDVLISGGDPLTMSTQKIDEILSRIRSIEHVEIIRIGTKAPVVNPFRITNELVEMLSQHHPLYINIHFTHPAELTIECREALNKLANAGIPLGSQTVLLKGVNDSPEIIKELYHKLLINRVKPYYLYSMDSIPGSENFKVPIQIGIEIMEALRGHTSGLCSPYFVIDTNGGKIPILPTYVKDIQNNTVILRNYQNKEYEYSW